MVHKVAQLHSGLTVTSLSPSSLSFTHMRNVMLTHICEIYKDGIDSLLCKIEIENQCIHTKQEKKRCFGRLGSAYIHY